MDIQIRWLIRRDLPACLEIDSLSFPRPWNEAALLDVLRQRNQIGMVAETRDGEIVGYMIYGLHKSQLQLLNVAVHPQHRRQGIGQQMVDKLKGKLSQQRRHSIEVNVCGGNTDAHLFFNAMGFWAIQTIPDEPWDKYFFRYTLDDAQPPRRSNEAYQPTNRITAYLE